jgi:5-(carboxyamino)imidazole ribonucleotide synthase
MIGAGQLARMTHQAAIDLGVELHVLAVGPTDPAVLAGASWTEGRPSRYDDLLSVAQCTDVLTFDHEVVPPDHLRRLADAEMVLRPSPDAFVLSQDKWRARQVLGAAGYPVPAHAPVRTADDVHRFAERHGWPVVLKATHGGYDGRGVRVLADARAAESALGGPGGPGAGFTAATGQPAASGTRGDGTGGDGTGGDETPAWIVEEHLDLAAECAVVLARRPSGEVAVYPPVGTVQVEGICRELTVPADLPRPVLDEAEAMARRLAEHIGATGLMALECFWTTDGRLLVNELALRPHNTGHITMEAAVTSQFHQHLRAVLDWPLGSPALVSPAATVNLIAVDTDTDVAGRLPLALADPTVHVHLYGKAPRPGRKIGHVTVLDDDVSAARLRARRAAELLVGAPVPGGAVPGGAVSRGAVPGGAVPGGAVSRGAVPGGAVGEDHS